MKMKTLFGGKMQIACLCLLALLVPAIISCNRQSSDMPSLLSTVPSSAGMVVGINLESVLEKAGCDVDGTSIKAGKEVKACLDKIGNGKYGAAIRLFLNGDSGIDPAGAVLFSDAYNMYVSAMIADTDKFIKAVEQMTGNQFSEAEGGVKICDNIAISGAQMWVCVSSYNTIDAKAVKNYSTFSENQSFTTKDVAESIAEMKTDIVGWTDINTMMKSRLSFSQMTQLNLVVGALYDNPASVAFSLDFQKGKMESKAMVLNEKGDKAKFLLPTSKIDTDLIKGLGGTADMIFATSITKDLINKIEKMTSSLGGNMFDEYKKVLGSIDGTVAVAMGKAPQSINGVVETDGNPSADLMNFLSKYGSTKKEEKMVRLTSGTVEGPLNLDKSSSYFDGAWLGVAVGTDKLPGKQEAIKTAVVMLKPDGNSLRLESTLMGDDSKNILLAFLEELGSGSSNF